MGKIRIVNKTGNTCDTHIYDTETGAELLYTTCIEYKVPTSGPPTATVTFVDVTVDLVAGGDDK